MKWKKRIKLGDLVRFNDVKRERMMRVHRFPGAVATPAHIFEIGLVVDTQGLGPVVSFPSRTQSCATFDLEVL